MYFFFCLLACRRRTNKTKSLDLLASIPSAWVFHSVQGAISSQHKKEELFLLFSYTHLWKRCPLVMYQRAQEKGRNKFPMRYKKERTTPLFVVKKVKASGHVGAVKGVVKSASYKNKCAKRRRCILWICWRCLYNSPIRTWLMVARVLLLGENMPSTISWMPLSRLSPHWQRRPFLVGLFCMSFRWERVVVYACVRARVR